MEKDPYLREIFASGYDEVIKDRVNDEVVLVDHKNKRVKKLANSDIFSIVPTLTIKTAMLHGGELYNWIAESDGSAAKFRQLISI